MVVMACPHCGEAFKISDHADRVLCPHCKGKVNVSAPERAEALEGGVRKKRAVRWPWFLCALATILIAIWHGASFYAAGSAVQQTAISASAMTWTLTFYVLARCFEKDAR